MIKYDYKPLSFIEIPINTLRIFLYLRLVNSQKIQNE